MLITTEDGRLKRGGIMRVHCTYIKYMSFVDNYISVFFPCRYFTFLVECDNPKACTILLRGASKDILNEVERNLQDAMNVARNVMVEPKLVAGGGASEMALAQVRCLIDLIWP